MGLWSSKKNINSSPRGPRAGKFDIDLEKEIIKIINANSSGGGVYGASDTLTDNHTVSGGGFDLSILLSGSGELELTGGGDVLLGAGGSAGDVKILTRSVRDAILAGNGTEILFLTAIDGTAEFNATPAAWGEETVTTSCSDLTTDLAPATNVGYFHAPFSGTITDLWAGVIEAPTGSGVVVDVNKNASTILSTKCTIDAGDDTSRTAGVQRVISDTSVTLGDKFTIDIDNIGGTTAGKGLIVYIKIDKS